jgi:hypothetical protein
MFGTEYNWLFETTTAAHGAPTVRLTGGSMATLAVAVFCFLCVALRAAPAGAADAAGWTLDGMDGIIEGIAIHPVTQEAFLSDVHNRCIWTRGTDGASAVPKKFSSDADGLLGVFALKISADGRTLWASCSALPEMKGYTEADKGRAFLAAYDLVSRRLLRKFELPADGRAHVLGDFILARDGTAYVTDSLAPVIWRLTPGADRLENWLEDAGFKSLQGVALDADGAALYVADYPRGLWRVSLGAHTTKLLTAPAGTNLRGIDGLYALPGGLVAVQNGLNPQRVLRLTLAKGGAISSATLLLAGRPEMTDLSLGQVVNGRFHFIANSGWELYGNPAATPAPRSVIILNTPL